MPIPPGEFGKWSEWSGCSKDCLKSAEKPGSKTRMRECTLGTCKQEDLQDKTICLGNPAPKPNFCKAGRQQGR